MQYRKKLTAVVCCVISAFLLSNNIIVLRTEAADNTDPAVTTEIPISCEGKDTTETFRYQLKGELSEFEQADTTELELKAGEKGKFSVTYTYPGTYHYTVSQVAGEDKYTTYDDTVFNVDVYVTENEEGILQADPVLYSQGDACKRVELIFKNTRKVPTKENTTNNTTNVTANKNKGKSSPEKIIKKIVQGAATGDTSGVIVWLVILIATGGILIFCTMRRKHKRRGDI